MTATRHRTGPDAIAAAATLLHRDRPCHGQPDHAARNRAFVAQRLTRGDAVMPPAPA